MTRHFILLALFAACAAQAEEAPASRFAPLEYLGGHCWKASFENGQTDEQCYDWLYGGKFLRSKHVVNSDPPYEGTTIFSWDSKESRIRFHYFTSTGAVSEGYLEPDGEGIRIPETHVGEDGKTTEMETSYQQYGEVEYRVVSREKTAEGWKEMWALSYRRVDAPESTKSDAQLQSREVPGTRSAIGRRKVENRLRPVGRWSGGRGKTCPSRGCLRDCKVGWRASRGRLRPAAWSLRKPPAIAGRAVHS